MLDAAIVDAANREESQYIQLSQDNGCDEMQGLHDAVYREEAELFADTEWHQINQYEVPNNVLTSSLETAKADAQGQLGASVNRNVVLDDCQQSVVDTFCASTAGLMLLIGAGGTLRHRKIGDTVQDQGEIRARHCGDCHDWQSCCIDRRIHSALRYQRACQSQGHETIDRARA